MRRIPSERSPVKVLLLSIVTCGLYYLYWIYVTAQDIDDFLGVSEIPPIVHLLLYVVTGTLWGFVFDLLTARRLMRMQEQAGLPVNDNTLLYLVLDLFGAGPYYGLGIVTTLLEQSSLNEVYRAASARYAAGPRRIP